MRGTQQDTVRNAAMTKAVSRWAQGCPLLNILGKKEES